MLLEDRNCGCMQNNQTNCECMGNKKIAIVIIHLKVLMQLLVITLQIWFKMMAVVVK